MFFSHRTSFKINFMSIMDKTVKDAIGNGRITNNVMPVVYGQLTGRRPNSRVTGRHLSQGFRGTAPPCLLT